jgi:uncharacterized sporulation protein YeaH/YhbH (DUF444 family)
LFSRGARDWLRHNQKVRDSVKGYLSDLVAGPDLITRPSERTVLVPVRLLEHARFRLSDADSQTGAGQGQGQTGDTLRPGQPEHGDESGSQGGGQNKGEVKFVLELKIDDIVDWLWEELKLPDLKPKQSSNFDDPDLVREGWDKRGPRARLDRRRTVKEAVKRRAVQDHAAPFTNDDLRFRQLVRRPRPATSAVVIFALDVSGSMTEEQRRLAKTFFFFALQGVRRQYTKVETVFVAHTVEAWEFSETEFFQVTASGGTVSSSAFGVVRDMLKTRFDPSQYNAYLFYASDGENATEDRAPASALLRELAADLNYIGYVETSSRSSAETEMSEIFSELQHEKLPVGAAALSKVEDVWRAIRLFFQQQADKEEQR